MQKILACVKNVCLLYSITFVFAFSRKFTKNRIRNDKMVANFYKRLKNSRRKNKNVKRGRDNNNHRNYNYNNIRGGGFGASSNCIQSCTSHVECYK